MGGMGSMGNQGGQQMDTSGGGGGGGGQQIKMESSGEGDDLEEQLKNVFFNDSDEGVSIEDACNQISNFTVEQIRAKVQEMAQEGHLYSTIDENHYKFTG